MIRGSSRSYTPALIARFYRPPLVRSSSAVIAPMGPSGNARRRSWASDPNGEIAVIIPLNHENMQGRRWPYVTIGLIALNTIIFVATHGTIEREIHETGEIQEHILLLAATHPNTPMNPAEQKLVDNFRHSQAKLWGLFSSDNRTPLDSWDVDMRDWTESRCEEEMIRLGSQLDQMQAGSVLGRYAFYPSRRVPISYLTANFLHGGWLHLIFDMWFFWLAGAILEDTWGRPLYTAVYLICGVAVGLWPGVSKQRGTRNWRIGSHRGAYGSFPRTLPQDEDSAGIFLLDVPTAPL